ANCEIGHQGRMRENAGALVSGQTWIYQPQRDHMHLLDRSGVLSVSVNTPFVPPDCLGAFPANPVRPTRPANANDYAVECWFRSGDVAHERMVAGTRAALKFWPTELGSRPT